MKALQILANLLADQANKIPHILETVRTQSNYSLEVAKSVREFLATRKQNFPLGRSRVAPALISDFAAGVDVSEKSGKIEAGENKYFLVERIRFALVRIATAGDGILGVPLPIALNESSKAAADTNNARGFWWKYNYGEDGDAVYVNGSYDYLSSDMAVGGYKLPVPILLAPKQSIEVKVKPMVAGPVGDEYTLVAYGEGRAVSADEYAAWKARRGV